MKKYIYQIGPIDFWTGWSSVNALRLQVNTDNPYQESIYFEQYKVRGHNTPEYYFSDFAEAISIKTSIQLIQEFTSWEGDGYMYLTAQPNDEFKISLCFAIKQSNNGTTFLCSDYPIENLKHCLVKVWYAPSKSKLSKLPNLKDYLNNDDYLLF